MLVLWLAFLPFPLWFIEQVLPYPAVVEELSKAVFVYRSASWRQAFGLGLVFGFSEAVLYLLNGAGLWPRLLITLPLHGLTAAIIGAFGRRYWWLGLPLAVAGHWVFNLRIGN